MPSNHSHKRHHIVSGQMRHLHGWKPDKPDYREHHYALPLVSPAEAAVLPQTMLDMRPEIAANLHIYDQGSIGSCTANGSIAAFRWLYWKMGLRGADIPDFSRLFQYAKTRENEGTPLDEDSGCTIRDAIDTLHKNGACPEALWPYDTSKFDIEPPMQCDVEAAKHQALSHHLVPNFDAIRKEIARWYPVVFGFTVYESFMSDEVARTGIVPVPRRGENTVGGHCMVIIGYCMKRMMFLCLNSWGEQWGDGGFCWMPFWFWQRNIASDHRVIHTGEGIVFPKAA